MQWKPTVIPADDRPQHVLACCEIDGQKVGSDCRIDRRDAPRQAVPSGMAGGAELLVLLTIANMHKYSGGSLAGGSRCESGAVAPLYSTLSGREPDPLRDRC